MVEITMSEVVVSEHLYSWRRSEQNNLLAMRKKPTIFVKQTVWWPQIEDIKRDYLGHGVYLL